MPKDLLAKFRAQKNVLKRITEVLGDGPRTVPEVAEEAGIGTGEALWYVMAMKKYGQVVEGEERDGYYEYALRMEEKEEA